MSETEWPEGYVAYYRMPLTGDTPARQRRNVDGLSGSLDRTLVGDSTEVMTLAYQGESSSAFDLSLECCRNLHAN